MKTSTTISRRTVIEDVILVWTRKGAANRLSASVYLSITRYTELSGFGTGIDDCSGSVNRCS